MSLGTRPERLQLSLSLKSGGAVKVSLHSRESLTSCGNRSLSRVLIGTIDAVERPQNITRLTTTGKANSATANIVLWLMLSDQQAEICLFKDAYNFTFL